MPFIGTNLSPIERLDHMTKASVDSLAEYTRRQHQKEYDEHLAKGAAEQAVIDNAAEMAAAINEFTDRILAKSPRFDQGAHVEVLTAKCAAAGAEFYAAIADHNTEVAIVSAEALSLGLTSHNDGEVVFIPGVDLGSGLHVRGHRIQRKVHLSSVAERAAVTGIRRAELEVSK
jgi:hypothetical protein